MAARRPRLDVARRPGSARVVGWLLLSLAIAAAGGGLFAALGLPAAWLTGAMAATVVAAFARAQVGPAAAPARRGVRLSRHLHRIERHARERGADARLARQPGAAGAVGGGDALGGRGLSRAGARLGSHDRPLRLHAGRLLRGGRDRLRDHRRSAAGGAGAEHPHLHPGGADAADARLRERRWRAVADGGAGAGDQQPARGARRACRERRARGGAGAAAACPRACSSAPCLRAACCMRPAWCTAASRSPW